jgi:hypothetical protein
MRPVNLLNTAVHHEGDAIEAFSFVVSGTFSLHQRVAASGSVDVGAKSSSTLSTSVTATRRASMQQHLASTLLSTTAKVSLPEALAINSYRGLDSKPKFVLAVPSRRSSVTDGGTAPSSVSAPVAPSPTEHEDVSGRPSSRSTHGRPLRPSTASSVNRSRVSLVASRRMTTATSDTVSDAASGFSEPQRHMSESYIPGVNGLADSVNSGLEWSTDAKGLIQQLRQPNNSRNSSSNDNNNNNNHHNEHVYHSSERQDDDGGANEGADDFSSSGEGLHGRATSSPGKLRPVTVTTSVIVPGGVFGMESPAESTVVASDHDCTVFAVSLLALTTCGVTFVPDLVSTHATHTAAAQGRIRRFMTEPIADSGSAMAVATVASNSGQSTTVHSRRSSTGPADHHHHHHHHHGVLNNTTNSSALLQSSAELHQRLLQLSKTVVGDGVVWDVDAATGAIVPHSSTTAGSSNNNNNNAEMQDLADLDSLQPVGYSTPVRSSIELAAHDENADERHDPASSYHWVRQFMRFKGSLNQAASRGSVAAGVPVPLSRAGRSPRSQVAYFMSPIDVKVAQAVPGTFIARTTGAPLADAVCRILCPRPLSLPRVTT